MIDLITATQDAFVAALKAASLPPGVIVFQHVPQGQKPPFTQIGEVKSSSEGAKDEQAESLSVQINSVIQGQARRPLLAIMHAVRVALDGETLEAEGVAFSRVRYVSAGASDAGEDGVTYVGISNFEVYAEPAD